MQQKRNGQDIRKEEFKMKKRFILPVVLVTMAVIAGCASQKETKTDQGAEQQKTGNHHGCCCSESGEMLYTGFDSDV